MKQNLIFGLMENEIKLICDSMNGEIHDTSSLFWKDSLISDIMEADELFYLAKKWEVNFEKLLDKLNKLSEIEMLLLIQEVMFFWGDDGTNYKILQIMPPHQRIIELFTQFKI